MTELLKDQDRRFLLFFLNQKKYAIPLLDVKEVLGYTPLTPVPQAPKHFSGLINLRGQVISIIDLRTKIGLAKGEIQPETSVIILDLQSQFVGVIVDSIESVLEVEPSEFSPAPECGLPVASSFLMGVAKAKDELILLLNIRSALDANDLNQIKKQSA